MKKTDTFENNVQLDFSYDLDGNMTYRPADATSGWTQVWNGENRMVETTKGSDRLTFKYDYMGRRVEKCMYNGNTLASKTLFVYDGFKCVEELDALDNNAVVMRHAWQPFDAGLDVILATTDGSGTCCFLHDANKNVMQKTAANGTVLEKYIYAPFGENTGAASTEIGFSSEQQEKQMGMIYYNYRYHYSKLGRWTALDPIWEDGGLNLYAICNNDLCNANDVLGLIRIIVKAHKPNSLTEWYKEQLKKAHIDPETITSSYKPFNERRGYQRVIELLKDNWSFSVEYERGPEDCICPDKSKGKIYLGQQIAHGRFGIYDSYQDDGFSKAFVDNRGKKRKQHYLSDSSSDGNLYIGGISYKTTGSYLDLPKDSFSLSRKVKVFAICSCPCEDDVIIGKPVEFCFNNLKGFIDENDFKLNKTTITFK